MPFKDPLHIPLRDVPPSGKEFAVDEPRAWEEPIREFDVACRLAGTPHMELRVQPVDEGWLLKGRIRASVIVPCARCAKDVPEEIDEQFEDYVHMPEEGDVLPESDFAEGDDHLLLEHGALMLDLGAIAWEQFALALPPVPLCRGDCRGLCPTCGKDLNEGPCDCPKDEGDPRLAVLRGLRLQKQ